MPDLDDDMSSNSTNPLFNTFNDLAFIGDTTGQRQKNFNCQIPNPPKKNIE
ncbi:hypothetical protein TrispH2_009792 [Trichoplax sp. H2]|nr:hypothetical protein TrispH2_009792 [Trichoplax sp. H2]|eukprot:RDD38154.1 hypothetical protein TrispH2_009792 [Trichoplax sp. H2]